MSIGSIIAIIAGSLTALVVAAYYTIKKKKK
ncbi:LPXTG cell wall anchor domain-containing protein [Pontimicrobium sp. MEBiC01747]